MVRSLPQGTLMTVFPQLHFTSTVSGHGLQLPKNKHINNMTSESEITPLSHLKKKPSHLDQMTLRYFIFVFRSYKPMKKFIFQLNSKRDTEKLVQ